MVRPTCRKLGSGRDFKNLLLQYLFQAPFPFCRHTSAADNRLGGPSGAEQFFSLNPPRFGKEQVERTRSCLER